MESQTLSAPDRIVVPDTLGALLPGFDGWRTHQRETVQAVIDAFTQEGVETVLLDAPTGSGKTPIGAAVTKMLPSNEYDEARALYLSHTIMLQEQQLRTLPEAVTVTGRRNHACLKTPFLAGEPITAEEADCPCEFARPGNEGGCSYYAQWFKALEAPDAVLNYAFVVRVIKAQGLRVARDWGSEGADMDRIPNPFAGRELMVCDEGHNLERALLDADTVDIYQSSFERYGYEVPRSVQFEDWPKWAGEIKTDLAERYLEAKTRKFEGLQSGSLGVDAFKEVSRLKALMTTVDNAIDLEKKAKHTPFMVGRTPSGYSLKPLWAWDRASHILLGHAPKKLIMSATLGEPNLAARLLGLEMGTWKYISIPSTFPVENRPVFYWPVSKMKHGMDESDKFRQARALVYLAHKFPEQPAVVHCNSYALGKYLLDAVATIDIGVRGRMLTHNSSERERVFKRFEATEGAGNCILVTPAATTGVDWDFLGWQMIPKVPYPDMSDDFTRLRYDYVDEDGEAIGKTVYQHEAVKTLVQAAGRCVRTPESRGVTVITDMSFWPLFKYVAPGAFPEWFREAVKWFEPKGG